MKSEPVNDDVETRSLSMDESLNNWSNNTTNLFFFKLLSLLTLYLHLHLMMNLNYLIDAKDSPYEHLFNKTHNLCEIKS